MKRLGRPATLVNARQRHIILETRQWETLDSIADQHGVSVSALLRQIVAEYLKVEDGKRQ